jgi:hypothetical protein
LGLALLPAGRRRNALDSAFADVLSKDPEDRVLPFDVRAAAEAAALAAARQRAGRPVDIRDTRITGIAQARRAAVATQRPQALRRSDRAGRRPVGLIALWSAAAMTNCCAQPTRPPQVR